MPATIPDSHKDLLENPVYATLVTVMPDGQPQASVVWCTYDGTNVLVNTARGRQKAKNMEARPMATVLLVDPQNPYRYLEVRGSVELSEEGALDLINALAKAYKGVDQYYGDFAPAEMKGKETRVIGKISPKRVIAFPPAG